MPSQPLRKKDVSSDTNQSTGLMLLIRQLVKQASQQTLSSSATGPEAGSQEVLLDVKVDDVRCVLIRNRRQTWPHEAHASLSPREREIARMVAEGYPNKTIAAVLDISLWTVGTHLRRVFAKLGVGSRAAMVARLIEHGLINSSNGLGRSNE